MHRNLKFIALVLICAGVIVFAAETAKTVPDLNKFKILNAYRKLSMSNVDLISRYQALCQKDAECSQKQKEHDALALEVTTAVDEAVKAGGFPKGTQFNIDLAKDSLTPVEPEQKK